MDKEDIKKELIAMSEPEFCAFTRKLMPGVENVYGVRLPNLRKLAKKIAKENWQQFLQEGSRDSYEEIMLQGMVIGYIKTADVDMLFPYIRSYVDKVDNWSTCDSFCCGLKITKEKPEQVWNFLQDFFHSDREFDIRFAIVMGLNYFITDQYKDSFLTILDKLSHEGYYVKMAVAWAVSMIYVKYPKETLEYIKRNHLDDFTQNKAIQKIRESYQVSKEEKEMLKIFKR